MAKATVQCMCRCYMLFCNNYKLTNYEIMNDIIEKL